MVVTEGARLDLKENRSRPAQGQCFEELLLVSLLWFFGFPREMTGQRRRGGMVSKEALVRCLSGWCVRGGAVRCGTVSCIVTIRHTAAGRYVERDKTGDR